MSRFGDLLKGKQFEPTPEPAVEEVVQEPSPEPVVEEVVKEPTPEPVEEKIFRGPSGKEKMQNLNK